MLLIRVQMRWNVSRREYLKNCIVEPPRIEPNVYSVWLPSSSNDYNRENIFFFTEHAYRQGGGGMHWRVLGMKSCPCSRRSRAVVSLCSNEARLEQNDMTWPPLPLLFRWYCWGAKFRLRAWVCGKPVRPTSIHLWEHGNETALMCTYHSGMCTAVHSTFTRNHCYYQWCSSLLTLVIL